MKRVNPSIYIYALITIVVIMLSLFLYSLLSRAGKHEVSVIMVPKTATLTVNNKVYKVRNNKIYLKPGNYTFVVQKTGFSSITQTVSVPTKYTTVFSLSAKSEEAKKWAEYNNTAYLEAQKVFEENLVASSSTYNTKNPVIRNLPYRSSLYNIDYSDKGDNVIIYITALTPLGRKVALERIRMWGYDPTNYLIYYKNFTNPFGLSEFDKKIIHIQKDNK